MFLKHHSVSKKYKNTVSNFSVQLFFYNKFLTIPFNKNGIGHNINSEIGGNVPPAEDVQGYI